MAGQDLGALPVQTPPRHWSVAVQALVSLHAVPSGAFWPEQVPVLGLQVPAMWHTSGALQRIGAPMVQTPSVQMSFWVQALPSLQVLPFGAFGFEQTPVAGAQTPATWHASSAVHVFGLPPTQAP